MPLMDFARLTKTLSIAFPGATETLTIVYDTDKLTPKAQLAFKAAAKADESTEAALTMLATILVRWDLESVPGVTVPLTYDGLSLVPWRILTAIFKAVSADSEEDPTKPAS